MLVRSRMTRDVITVSPATSVLEARALTRAHQIRHLPVVADDRLVGVVSDRDLRLALPPAGAADITDEERQRLLRSVLLGELMTRVIVTTTPETPIEDAARLLYEHRIGCLPVMSGTELVGILTETDVLRAFVELFGAQADSTRLEVRMPNRPGELARVVRLVGIDHKLNITGLVLPPVDDDTALAIMFVQTGKPQPLIEALEKMGYEVGWPALD